MTSGEITLRTNLIPSLMQRPCWCPMMSQPSGTEFRPQEILKLSPTQERHNFTEKKGSRAPKANLPVLPFLSNWSRSRKKKHNLSWVFFRLTIYPSWSLRAIKYNCTKNLLFGYKKKFLGPTRSNRARKSIFWGPKMYFCWCPLDFSGAHYIINRFFDSFIWFELEVVDLVL